MTLGLKFLLCLNGHFFNSKKTLFMYYGFSVATNVYCEVVGKVFVSQEWVQAEIIVTIKLKVNLVNFRTL